MRALFRAVDPLGARSTSTSSRWGFLRSARIDLAAANAPGAKYVVKPGYDDRAANYITL
ncbi:MAG: hypothetical protein R3F11_18140 [Verrucomicrobiales bacterium]